ncbi:hypothetical protein RFI_03548 [Reticulomyxa filosa]|uniref:Kelch motif family protein n=1 Tax=Reticulomyxa filosa TaxID=46433 RepID=X6P5S3_RETFI|nr:hypothetical protein RFI_03548 [Reticulomyxa filosa]|eukprot:ETO33556.1 hypothetical protein RFI_03548 [Reticulomyxa filosa]
MLFAFQYNIIDKELVEKGFNQFYYFKNANQSINFAFDNNICIKFLYFDYIKILQIFFLKKKGLPLTFQKKAHLTCLLKPTMFQSLPQLPKAFSHPQCILFKDELLLCGGLYNANPNEIHLLTFGGQDKNLVKQTFLMKYKSVWEMNEGIQSDSKIDN